MKNERNGSFIIRFAESKITVSQKTLPKSNFTLAVKVDDETYHLRDFLTYPELEKLNKNEKLFDILSKITNHARGTKLLENGRVLANANGQESNEWIDVSEKGSVESDSCKFFLLYFIQRTFNFYFLISDYSGDYRAECAAYQVVLKKSNK